MCGRQMSGEGPRDLDIVIVSYNTCDMLRACLASLPAALNGLSRRVHVVDNRSSDGSVEMVRREFADVQLTVAERNLGFSGGNNLALRHVDARYVLLLNPDTECLPGSLHTLVTFMDSHPEAGACGPQLLNSDGSLQKSGARFPTLFSEAVGHLGFWRINPEWHDRTLRWGRSDFSATTEVDQVTGACLMVRREALEQVGPLDERFFMFYEEVDWCKRLHDAGWRIYYVPEARVTHHWMGAVRRASRAMTRQLFKSQIRYHWKHGGWPARVGILAVAGIGMLKNELLHLGVAVKRVLRRAGLVGARTR